LPQSDGGSGSDVRNVSGGGELCNVENPILIAVADMVGSFGFITGSYSFNPLDER
jgi:hypothetical protein